MSRAESSLDGCDCFQQIYLLERHQYWRLRLSLQQGYLGWCLIVLHRHETEVAQLTDDEVGELWLILRRIRAALTRLLSPDHFNYAFLGNVVRHVHMHVMPRYESPRSFAGVEFVDRHWGWFAIPGMKDASPELLDTLSDSLRAELARTVV